MDRMFAADTSGICNNDPIMNWTDEEVQRWGLRLKLKDGCSPPPPPEARRIGHALLPIVNKQLQELLDAGIIKRGHSCTGCPIHVVPKPRKRLPDGTLGPIKYRTCVDMRAINKVLQDDSGDTPNIADAIGSIKEIARLQHRRDLAAGITPDQKDATADDPKQAVL
jgi:hypothetical protein